MITKTVNKIARSIDAADTGKPQVSDDELVALVKKAYRRTAKICSRGCWRDEGENGYTDHYASAYGALYLAFGPDILAQLGASIDWQQGFVEGFEYTGSRWDWDLWTATDGKEHRVEVPEPDGSEDFRDGFVKGKMMAIEIFKPWPGSPDIHSKPEV